MYHFTYKVSSHSGKYYVGRHSTRNLNDNYLGSGKWIKDCLNGGTKLKREILVFYENFDELKMAEGLLLEKHINDPKCMNFSDQPVGWPSGDRHHMRTSSTKRYAEAAKKRWSDPEFKKRASLAMRKPKKNFKRLHRSAGLLSFIT